jgi:peptide/nickel transport system permease protein
MTIRAWILMFLLAAILAGGLLAPFDPAEQHRDSAFQSPNRTYRLGTDQYGRDQLSRLLHGARLSLVCAATATVIALALAILPGTLAGFYGGLLDELLMRGTELFLALPWLYLLLAVRAALPLNLPPETTLLVLSAILGAVGWARPARLLRGLVLSLKHRDFVQAARGFGASDWYLLRVHILPETLSILKTQAGLLFPQFVLAEAVLSLLGLGIGEPAPSWGSMLSGLRDLQVLTEYWWMGAPAAALLLVMFLWNFLIAPTPNSTVDT